MKTKIRTIIIIIIIIIIIMIIIINLFIHSDETYDPFRSFCNKNVFSYFGKELLEIIGIVWYLDAVLSALLLVKTINFL